MSWLDVFIAKMQLWWYITDFVFVGRTSCYNRSLSMKPNAACAKSRWNAVEIAASRRLYTPKLRKLTFLWETYLLFYGVHSAVVVIVYYVSTIQLSQNGLCPSAPAQTVSLNISRPVSHHKEMMDLSITHSVCASQSDVCVLFVIHTAEFKFNFS